MRTLLAAVALWSAFGSLSLLFARALERTRIATVDRDTVSRRKERSPSVTGQSFRNAQKYWQDSNYGKSAKGTYRNLTSEERLALYDQHNPGCRNSSDPQVRLYGKCGCGMCGETRKQWAEMPTALEKPGRTGGGSMASVNLCDREGCKSMVQGAALGLVALVTASDHKAAERIEREICPGCVGDVMALLNTAPVSERQPAYREPWKRPEERDPMDAATSEQLAAALLTKLMGEQRTLEVGPTTAVDSER